MWVRLMGWMIADEEPPLPAVGSLLADVGLRLRGEVTTAPPNSPDGIFEVDDAPPQDVMYRLVGQILEPRDFDVDTGDGGRHAGVEFVLVAGPDRFQVEADGWARDLAVGSRVMAIGHLELVGAYEWDAFELVESRADWLVKAVADANDGDVMLDLAAPSGG